MQQDETVDILCRHAARKYHGDCLLGRPACFRSVFCLAVPMPVDHAAGRHSVILCNPDPRSFDHSVATAYCEAVSSAGQVAMIRDLYAMRFDPVLRIEERSTHPGFVRSSDVSAEWDEISGSDIFVLVYPIWFGTPPAMLKGYIERVFGAGVSPPDIQAGTPSTLLGGKRLVSFSTSATKSIWLDEQGQVDSLRRVFDLYLVQAFGMHSQEHHQFDHITTDLTQHFANGYLLDVAHDAKRICTQITIDHDGLSKSSEPADRHLT